MPIASSKPRKQRKFMFTAPFHVRRKMISAHLSKDLRKRFKIRSFPIRRGDEVQVMRGSQKKQKGKISRIDRKNYQVFVEGIKRKRTAGTETQIPFHASNLLILNLDLSDKKRVKALERKTKTEIKIEQKKPETKKEEAKEVAKEVAKEEAKKEETKKESKNETKPTMQAPEGDMKSREKWRAK
jgi:large subunit ribosomal protein L24